MEARSEARRSGFEAAFREHYEAVRAYAIRRTTDPSDAEDAAAETFAIAWRRWEDRPGDPLPWLYAIARRVLANSRRAGDRFAALRERLGTAGPVQTADPTERALKRAELLAALAALPEPERELLLLVEWEGLERKRAARALGCSLPALYVRLHRARRRLLYELEAKDAANPGPGRAPRAVEES